MIKIEDKSSEKLKARFPLLSFDRSILKSSRKKYCLTIINSFLRRDLRYLRSNYHYCYQNCEMILNLQIYEA